MGISRNPAWTEAGICQPCIVSFTNGAVQYLIGSTVPMLAVIHNRPIILPMTVKVLRQLCSTTMRLHTMFLCSMRSLITVFFSKTLTSTKR